MKTPATRLCKHGPRLTVVFLTVVFVVEVLKRHVCEAVVQGRRGWVGCVKSYFCS